MWERSQVEQLTGLSRHMIQDLCYQDTKRGGLAFWEPAVSKPGYSRFDEGDLMMFFLVGQLKRAGFTLAEVEATVFDILEEDGALDATLRKKAHVLHERRTSLDGQLTALGCLEEAAAAEPSERLYAVMTSTLAQSIDRAIAEAAGHQGTPAEHEGTLPADSIEQMRARLLSMADTLVAALRGEVAPGGSFRADEKLRAIAAAVRELVGDGCEPTCPAAHRVVMAFVHYIAISEDDARDAFAEHACVTDASSFLGFNNTKGWFALRALVAFFKDAGNGVPIELVLGNGSFAFLGKAVAACAASFDSYR